MNDASPSYGVGEGAVSRPIFAYRLYRARRAFARDPDYGPLDRAWLLVHMAAGVEALLAAVTMFPGIAPQRLASAAPAAVLVMLTVFALLLYRASELEFRAETRRRAEERGLRGFR